MAEPMANEGFIRQLTNERAACPSCGGSGREAHGRICQRCGGSGTVGARYGSTSLRNTLLAGLLLTAAGVVLVWLFMFLLANG